MGVENGRSKRIASLAIGAVLLMAVCVGVSYFVSSAMVKSNQSWEHNQAHGHQWLHAELELTDSEIEAIDAFEPGYRKERAGLLEDFNKRTVALRDLLVKYDSYSPEVNAAIHELHLVHGALQELSIRHYYDMMSVLPAEKQDTLRKLAVEALSEPE